MAGFMEHGNNAGLLDGMNGPTVTPAYDYYDYDTGTTFQGPYQNESHLQVPWPDERPSARMDMAAWIQEWYVRFRFSRKGWTWWDWLKYFLPFFGVIETYNLREYFLYDLLAGVTVATVLVPQGLSYAKIAGLPSVFGLYGGFVPVLCYAFLGTSRQLGVGPVSVTSGVLGSGLPNVINSPIQSNPNSPSNPAAQQDYNNAAIQVAFIAGIMYTAVGILNLGWLTNFWSHAVICGFMSGTCIVIGLGQVKYIFGYNTRPNVTTTTNATKSNATNITNITSNVSKLLNTTANSTNSTKSNSTSNSSSSSSASTISFPRDDPVQLGLMDLFDQAWLPYFKWIEFVMGISWIIFLLALRYVCNHNPYRRYTRFISFFGPLFVVILSTSLTYSYRWDLAPIAIRITGSIPSGLPGSTVSWFFPMTNFTQKLLLAIIVFFIDMLESISIARALAVKNGYEISASSEIRGLGIANIIGSCFNCYTNTGSFSRSSVNDSAGAKTQLAGFVTSMCIMIVLLCLTQLFYYLPLNAMAAIIIAAMPPLFNWREFLYLWRVDKFDCLVFTVAMLAVLFLGVEYGLAIAVGLSLFLILLYSAFPQISVLGNISGTEMYRNVRQFPEAQEWSEFLILRIDAPIYFANLNPIRKAVEYYERRIAATGRELRYLVLDLSACSLIDGPATHFLKSLCEENRKRGIQLVLVQPNKSVTAELMRAGLDELIGREYIGMNMHHVLERIRAMDGLNASTTSKTPGKEDSSSSGGYEYY